MHDTFILTRPQWKLASSLEEAAKAFQLAVSQDQKSAGVDKGADMDDATSGPSSDDENADVDEMDGDGDEETASEEEDVDVSCFVSENHPGNSRLTVCIQEIEEESDRESDSEEDEAIVVTRQEEAVDPEDEAEFEREYAKMMAESLESRKFERKQLFDVPLPVRAKPREASSTGGPGEQTSTDDPVASKNMMQFSLLTKKGNRQQVCDRPPATRLVKTDCL